MTKVLGMLVALVALCAMPAVALAGGDNTSSGNTQDGTITQGAQGGDSSASGGSGDGGGDASSGDGGDAGNQAAIVQQNAGDDANASIDQNQSFGGGNGGGNGNGDNDNDNDGVGGGNGNGNGNGTSGGIGGGSESVTLARTGFDAWVLALLGGLSLAGGLGVLVAQRRGRLNA